MIRVFKFLMAYVDTLELPDFDCTYRLGKPGSRNRPILCKFVKEKVRNTVASIKMNLNDEDSEKKIYLNDDLPQLINDHRADFRTVLKLAKSQNIPATMNNSRITVNNVTYTHKNLDCLPLGLKLEDAKMINVHGGIAFFTSHAWASNFYPAPIDIQGQSFYTSEQAYQYAKGIRSGDPHTATLILRAKSPKEAKLLGSGVTPKGKWDDDKIDVMRHILTEKFKQHADLRQKLLATGQANLIEASLDTFWGAKATLTSKSIKDGSWTGANTLGKILAEVRHELKREVDTFNMSFSNAPMVCEQLSDPRPMRPTNAVASQPSLSQDTSVVNKSVPDRVYPLFGTGVGRGRGKRRSLDNSPNPPSSQPQSSRKNKIRPSSSSSTEGTYSSVLAANKKQRIHSPLSALPPPRLEASDLFACQESAVETSESPFDDGEYY